MIVEWLWAENSIKQFKNYKLSRKTGARRGIVFVEIIILEDSEEGLWVTGISDNVEIIIQGQGFVEDGQEVITNPI